MKFTSVPKKLLLTGMSAAMVAAFAPAAAAPAALAKTGDASPVVVENAQGEVVESFPTAKSGDEITLSTADNAQGYKFSKFTTADGADIAADSNASKAGYQYEVGDLAEGSSQTTIKAVYAEPSITGLSISQGGAPYALVNDVRDGDDVEFTVGIDNSNLKKGATYTLTVTDPSGATFTKTWAPKADSKGSTADSTAEVPSSATITYQGNPASNADANSYAKLSTLAPGAFKVTLSDGTGTVDSESYDVAKVTVSTGSGSSAASNVYYYRTGKGTSTSLLNMEYAGKSFVDSDGLPVTDATLVTRTGSVELTETDATQTVASATYSANRSVRVSVADSAAASGDSYEVTVTDPTGAQVFQGTKAAPGDFSFSFDQADSDYRYAGKGEVAGKYVVQVTKTTASGEKTTVKDNAKLVLTEVKTEAGTGAKLADGAKDLDVFYQDSYDLPAAGTIYEAADGYVKGSVSWQLGGKALSSSNAVKAGESNTLTAVAQVDKTVYLPTPTLSGVTKDAETDGKYTIQVADSDSAAQLQYSLDGGSTWRNISGGKFDVTNAASVLVRAAAVTGKTASGSADSKSLSLTFNAASGAYASATAGDASALEQLVGRTDGKWLSLDATAKAIASGKSAIDGLGYYYTDADAADATVLAQYKALYEAVASDAAAQLAPYAGEAPVIVGQKVYTMTASSYEAAQKAIADETAAVEKAVGAEGATQRAKVSAYADGVRALVESTNEALNGTVESKDYTVSDVQSAAAANEAIQKVAADYASVTADNAAAAQKAADAALAQYEALSDSAKKLVTSSDITKAQAVKTAADKLVSEKEAAEEQAAKDRTAASAVTTLVKKIPESNADLAAKQTAIDKAVGAYEALTDAQKELVTGYSAVAEEQARVDEARAAQATKVTGVKVKAAKKKATVSWSQLSGYKYQVRYAKSGKKAKTVKTSAAKKTVKKLSSKKKYTFKVRTYKKVGDTTFYGKWSKKVTKKIK